MFCDFFGGILECDNLKISVVNNVINLQLHCKLFYNNGIKLNEYMDIILRLQRTLMIPYCNC